MPGCRAWKEQLLDVALGAVPATAFDRHLASCERCRDGLARLRARSLQIEAAVRQVAQAAGPSPDFRARVVAAAEAAPAMGKMNWRPGMVPTVVGAAAALVVATILISWPAVTRHRSGPSARPASAIAIAEWRSPTDHLLRSPGPDALNSLPRLGDFYLVLNNAGANRQAKRSNR